ncbi:BREX-1 system phosphatase PglZ type A [Ureibacillus thermophilus]|uniref:BREX-1 system phosphatase PglZ type A n=1 Tax=Ureibacillus thermophilus TaxID=367743 RepID=UPI0036241D1E
MNLTQITSALQDIFNEPLEDGELRKIVFWVDRDQEFIEDIQQFTLEDVKIETLTENNQFYMKYLLEEEDPTSNYLIYTNLDLEIEHNWLADTVLYSKTFYADRISLILNDLRMDSSLRPVIKKYEKFFNNKERYRKFQAFQMDSYNEEMIEIAIMSVLCNLKTPDFEEVLKTVLMDTLEDENNKYLTQMEKFFDIDAFWKYAAEYYGYERETKSLKTLFIHLAVTAFSHSVKEEYLADIKDYIAVRNRTNALVFIDHWMHHKADYVVFNDYIELVEREIQLPQILLSIPIDEFKQAEIFPYIDKAIIMYIANSLLEKLEDFEEYIKLIKLRRAKHFYERFAAVYEALYYTVKMHEFYKEYSLGIPTGQAIDMFNAYQTKYHVMDTYYRKFYVAYDQENNELLKKLKEQVEYLYIHWYMGELSSHWTQAVKSEMTEQWSLPGVLNQQKFYSSIIAPHIYKGERVFVIISDALRYEIGVELAERLNAETIGICEIQSMLGVIPSVTKLGMAALLPHKTIDINESGQVLVNGQVSSGLEHRKSILEGVTEDSIAIYYQDILNMNKAGRRETFKGKKLIYIYHDTIDAVGDKATTEIYTFDAAEKAVNQLYDLVKIIRDDLSGTNIYITADHGFLYQREPLQESDKIIKEPMEMIEAKSRYILSKEKKEVSGQTCIDLSSVIRNELQFFVYVPNGTIRNRNQGSGINFVHGGASLQEIVVPLLIFKNKRAGQKGVKSISKVDIRLTSTMRRITNSIFHLSFFQTEKVEEKMNPRTVIIYMADEEGNILSNEERVIGDRTSDDPAERTFKLQFALKSLPYDRNKTYYLIIKDMETGIMTEKIPFSINLGIVSDFDF